MSEEQLYNLLQGLDIQVAYDHFIQTEEYSVSPPFILYRNTDSSTFKADDRVLLKTNQYIIDLITRQKDIKLESELEELFNNNHLPYDKFEDYIEQEDIFQIRYFI